jgi:hypothetical protein
MTATNTHTLTVLRSEADGLIREEIRTEAQRAALYKGVRDAVLKVGVPVSDVSAATGLTVTEIRKVLDEVPALTELAELAGVG